MFSDLIGYATQRLSGHAASEKQVMTVRIIGDSKLLWESRRLVKKNDKQPFSISFAGVKELELNGISASGSNDYAHLGLINTQLFALGSLGKITPVKTTAKTPMVTPPPQEFKKGILTVWEVSFGKGTLRVVFKPGGTPDKGHKWTIDGKKFSFGYDSDGSLFDDGLHASGRWRRGSEFTARLLAKGIDLKTCEAKNVTIPKDQGSSAFHSIHKGPWSETIMDAWELGRRHAAAT